MTLNFSPISILSFFSVLVLPSRLGVEAILRIIFSPHPSMDHALENKKRRERREERGERREKEGIRCLNKSIFLWRTSKVKKDQRRKKKRFFLKKMLLILISFDGFDSFKKRVFLLNHLLNPMQRC